MSQIAPHLRGRVLPLRRSGVRWELLLVIAANAAFWLMLLYGLRLVTGHLLPAG